MDEKLKYSTLVSILFLTFSLFFSGLAIPAIASSHTSVPVATVPPTFYGSAGKYISGPIKTNPFEATSPAIDSVVSEVTPATSAQGPLHAIGKPAATTTSASLVASTLSVPPVVSCSPMGPGCDSISPSSTALTNPLALNVVDNDNANPLIGVVEPPDQGLCAGNGYVMEVLNLGELKVYSTGLKPVSAVLPLDSVMGLTAKGWGSGGDISCMYDYGYGGHWFITQFVTTNSEASGGVFAPNGCFLGGLDACREGIAVSVTNDPMGAYWVYFFDPNLVNSDQGTGTLLNDFAKIGNTQSAILFFYDEFNNLPPFEFNGAQEFAISKYGLENGLAVTNPYFNVAYENLGLLPTPDNQGCSPLCSPAWYAVIPAQSPDPTQFDNANGGTGFMLGALDTSGVGDHRFAVFDWQDLSALNSNSCSKCSGITFGEQLFKATEVYMDEGGDCLASAGGNCGLGPQKPGPIPLGDNCVIIPASFNTSPCPENGIASNGDTFTQVSYSDGQIWGAVSTLLVQQFQGSPPETHLGAAYWAISTNTFDTKGVYTLAAQGYVSAAHEDLEFPTIAATDGPETLMSFTLNGNGGPSGADNGGFYPSSAYGILTTQSGGLLSSTIHISALGRSPYDGSTEYLSLVPYPPRWGDYGWAIYVPSTPGSSNGNIYFASEYIQHPNCNDAKFLKDPTCGGTRGLLANWGSSVSSFAT